MNESILVISIGVIGCIVFLWYYFLRSQYLRYGKPFKIFCWVNWIYWLYVDIRIWQDDSLAYPCSLLVKGELSDGFYIIVAAIVGIAIMSQGSCFIKRCC